MRGLLLVAHGSRRAESNLEIEQLAGKIEALLKSRGKLPDTPYDKTAETQTQSFDVIEYAFLEMAKPGIEEAIACMVAGGVSSVMVLPYFLAKGAHVASDIPEVVDLARKANPSINIEISPYFGASEAVPELLVQLALTSNSETA